MSTTGELTVILAALGIVSGACMVYFAPRLAAYRFEDPIEMPGWRVLVPLVGGRLAGWRPLRTLGVELATGCVLGALTVHYGGSTKLLLSSIYSVLLIAIAYVDLDYRLVLNRLSYPAFVVGLAGSAFWPGIGLVNAAVGAAVGLILMGAFQLVGRGRLGTGDTKLAVVIGAMRGFPGVLNALFLGVVLGAVAALFILVVLRRGRKERFAYAPYLAAGAVLSFFVTPS